MNSHSANEIAIPPPTEPITIPASAPPPRLLELSFSAARPAVSAIEAAEVDAAGVVLGVGCDSAAVADGDSEAVTSGDG